MIAPLPANEATRLDALHRLHVLDSPPERDFDDLARLAATICGAPIGVVSFVDRDRVWLKSSYGMEMAEAGRNHSFCAHAIGEDGIFLVPDAAADARFVDNPYVVGEPNIRFYAGFPLTTPDGYNVGALCAVDRVPRELTRHQLDALAVLARQVVAQLLLRRQVADLKAIAAEREKEQETFRVLFEQSSDAHLIFDERDGILDCNRAAVAMLRYRDKSEVLALHPAVLSPEFQPDGRRSMDKCIDMDAAARQNGFHRVDWTHLRADGEEFPCEATLTPVELHGRTVLLMVWHDLTERKRAEDALRQSEERFRSVVEELAEGIVLLDRDSRAVLRTNRAFLDLLGYTADEAAALTQYDFVAHDREDVDAKMQLVEQTGRASLGLRKYRRKDGEVIGVSVSGSFLTLDGRAVLCLVVEDRSEQMKAETALRDSEAKFRGIVDRLAEGLFVIDPGTRRFVEANAAVLAMLGYSAAEFFARTPLDIVAVELPEVVARNVAGIDDALARHGHCDLGRKHLRRRDGSAVPVEVRVTLIPDGGAGLHAVIVRDLTEQIAAEDRLFEYQCGLEEANAQLQALAVTDALTGVNNRGAFNGRLAEEVDRATRHARPLSVLLMDVDHFKAFNDAFGHPAGDEVLKEVAATFRKTARTTDFVARYGGEEFVILLPDTDYAGAMVLAERCRRAIAGRPWDRRPVTVSVGVATLALGATDGSALVREADEALYRSKAAGRNRIHFGSGAIPTATTYRAPVGRNAHLASGSGE